MEIFLSYSRAQRETAERLALSLRGQGHGVFYDRSSIEAGSDYELRIRDAVERADLFVFLISPDSVAPGSYPLAEVGLAEKKWSYPGGHVLPLMVQPAPIDRIPPYLRAVSILEPRGDFVAEASAAVARMARGRHPGRLRAAIAIAAVLLILLASLGYSRLVQQRQRRQQAAGLVDAANLEIKAGAYEAAFNALAEASIRFPEATDVHQAQTRAALLWLRNINVRVGERTFADVVNIVRPVLSADAAQAKGAEAGDIFAHLGWCEYLRARETSDGDPVPYFKRAIEVDAANPYAHAMWGFWILFARGPLADATAHFTQAAASGRETRWVRNLQLAGLLLYPDDSREAEAIRVVDTMRSENLMVDDSSRLWSVYQVHLLNEPGDDFLKLLAPGPRTGLFQWLYPAGSLSEAKIPAYHLMTGRLLESDGNGNAALSEYRWVEDYMRKQKSGGSLLNRAEEGIRRLTNERAAK